MNSLPELTGGRIHYRLPLAEETALRLADVLLADSAQQRAERLEAALAGDPPLAVWAILVAPEPADRAAPLPALVTWLAPRLAGLLAVSPAPAQGAGWDAARQSELDQLLADARRSAAAVAGVPKTAADRNRQFIRLAAGVVEWLMHSGTPRPDRHEAVAMVPAWLAPAVAQNLDHAGGFGADHENGQPVDGPADAVAAPPWSEMLDRLAARTVRLAELETDFAGALEKEKLAALKEFAYGAG
ncbi:MAG TPA: hypothetical protein VGG30_04680, partial [Pirellulales bacterium]